MAEIDDKGLVIVPEAELKESMWPGGIQPGNRRSDNRAQGRYG